MTALADLRSQPKRGKTVTCTACGAKVALLWLRCRRPEPLCERCLSKQLKLGPFSRFS